MYNWGANINMLALKPQCATHTQLNTQERHCESLFLLAWAAVGVLWMKLIIKHAVHSPSEDISERDCWVKFPTPKAAQCVELIISVAWQALKEKKNSFLLTRLEVDFHQIGGWVKDNVLNNYKLILGWGWTLGCWDSCQFEWWEQLPLCKLETNSGFPGSFNWVLVLSLSLTGRWSRQPSWSGFPHL